jgi:two-component system OmpR family response regulator
LNLRLVNASAIVCKLRHHHYHWRMFANVLLIDDDTGLTELLGDYLTTEGFAVMVAHDGASGAALALGGQADIVVLDIMLPGQSGLDTLRHIRATSTLPVLMLTGRGDDADRILGLELGADDYVAKPCSPRELTARLRAILKRTRPTEAPMAATQIGDLSLRPGARQAELRGMVLALTSTEYSLLEILARHAGTVVSKERLSEQALGGRWRALTATSTCTSAACGTNWVACQMADRG